MAAGVIGVLPTTAKSDTDIAYRVENGNIYFDPATGTVTGCDDTVTSAVIPETIDGVAVTGVGEAAFEHCGDLTSIEAPSVASIGDRAFYDCGALVSVEMPSVTSIGGWAFEFCGQLSQVKLPKSLISLGKGAFWYCYALKEIEVDGDNPSFTSEDNVLFDKNMTVLIQYPQGKEDSLYTAPQSLTSIGEGAFSYSKLLTEVKLPNVTSIGASAFMHCDALKDVEMPKAADIGSAAFEYCRSLSKIEPTNVTSIGNEAFEFCESLVNVKAPNVIDIGNKAFEYCKSLAKIELPKVTGIGNEAFAYCDALQGVELPNAASVGEYAFYCCRSLSGVHLPKALKSVGSRAFEECAVLNDVNYEGSETDREKITIDKDSNYAFLNRAAWHYNVKFSSETDKYADEIEGYVRSADTSAAKGEIEASGVRPEAFYKNIVSNDISADGDYIIRDCTVEVSETGALSVGGKITVENGELAVYGSVNAEKVELKNGGRVMIYGKLKTGDVEAGGKEGSGTLLSISGEASARDVVLTGYAEAEISGRLSAESFTAAKSAHSRVDGGGKVCLLGASASVADVELLARQSVSEIQRATEKDALGADAPGIEELGGKNSEANEALKKYLAAYLAGVELSYPNGVSETYAPWREKLSVYCDGSFKDISLCFGYVKTEGKTMAEVKYSYKNSEPKLCFTFATGNESELVKTIKKYADSTYDSRIAFYLNMPLGRYVNDRNSALAKLLWIGVKELKSAPNGGGKYVKDFFKKGADEYFEKTAGAIEAENKAAESVPEVEATASGEPFSDEYFARAMMKALGTDSLDDDALANVTKLDLSDSLITDISGIEKCVNLKTLNLEGNAIKSIEALRGLAKLESINLDGNSVSDLTPLKNLTGLKELRLKSNFVSDAEPLRELKALETLDLSFNFISDTLWAQKLTGLTKLNITGNRIASLNGLGGAVGLKTLWTGKNALSDLAGIESLELENLSIVQNAATDISKINTANLEFFDAGANRISDIPALPAPKLKTLYLSGNDILDVSFIAGLSSLEELYMSGCGLFSSDLEYIPQSVKKLDVSSNSIIETEALSRLNPLCEVSLANNYVSETAEFSVDTPVFTASGIYFLAEDVNMVIGETVRQNVMTVPYNADAGDVTWSSSDEGVAEVNDGAVTAKGLGSAVITASNKNGLKAEFTVNVISSMIYNVKISEGKVSAEIENVTDKDYGEVEAIIAIYKDNSLINVQRETISDFAVGYSKTIETDAKDGQSARVFLWKGTEPICESVRAKTE